VKSRQKTLIEIIQNATSITDDDKAKAIAGITRIAKTGEAAWPDIKERGYLKDLDAAFVWSQTEEGHDFWESINSALLAERDKE
jgi:hypothetical protein